MGRGGRTWRHVLRPSKGELDGKMQTLVLVTLLPTLSPVYAIILPFLFLFIDEIIVTLEGGIGLAYLLLLEFYERLVATGPWNKDVIR